MLGFLTICVDCQKAEASVHVKILIDEDAKTLKDTPELTYDPTNEFAIKQVEIEEEDKSDVVEERKLQGQHPIESDLNRNAIGYVVHEDYEIIRHRIHNLIKYNQKNIDFKTKLK